MSVRRMLTGYATILAAITTLFLAAPHFRTVTSVLLGIVAVGAIGVGVRRYRPAAARGWWLLAGGLLCATAARATYGLLPGEPGAKSQLWIVHLLVLVMVVLVLGGLLRLSRGSGRRRPDALLDVVIFLLGTGLLAAVLVGLPYAVLPPLSPTMAVTRAAYVLRDVLLLAGMIYLLTGTRRSAPAWTLALGTAGLLTYDTLFRLGRIHNAVLESIGIELAWLVFVGAWGAAALLPTMTSLGAPRETRHRTAALRLGTVAVAALVPSALLLMASWNAPAWFRPLVAASAVMLALMFARTVGALRALQRRAERERVLREAVADLAGAADEPAVARIVETALRRLAGHPVRTAVTTGAGPRPALLATVDSRTETVLELPADRTVGSPRLVVAGHQAHLGRLRRAADIIATQAGLALDRMRLLDEARQRTNQEYFRALVQTAADVILVVGDDDRITFASPSATTLLGPAVRHGTWLPGVVDGRERVAAQRLLERARSEGRSAEHSGRSVPPAVSEWAVHGLAGGSVPVEVSCRYVHDAAVHGVVVTLHDLTERRRLERELAAESMRDPVTGLPNRRQAREWVREGVFGARRRESRAALLALDLDNFTAINDQYGAETGDEVLRTVAARLRQELGPDGWVARLGGDEFGAFIEAAGDDRELDELAGRLAAAVRRPIRIGEHLLRCSATVGVATTADAGSADDLGRNATLSLRAGKNTARGSVRHYDASVRSALTQDRELREALELALDNDELELDYQPIVALDSGQTVGLEALLRWKHPARGRLGPDSFIEIAEDAGLIGHIGAWVLHTAMAEAARWQPAGGPDAPYIAVNVSARQFRSPGFVEHVQALLVQTGLAARRLRLEITESIMLREDDEVWRDLHRLREVGIKVAIDDFGTGYSALSYLRHVPIDVIKLDRQFVSSLAASRQQQRLVEGVIGLGAVLGLEVVAEGIETAAQRDLLRTAGCGYGQGFYFARPLRTERVRRWVVPAGRPAAANRTPVSSGRAR